MSEDSGLAIHNGVLIRTLAYRYGYIVEHAKGGWK